MEPKRHNNPKNIYETSVGLSIGGNHLFSHSCSTSLLFSSNVAVGLCVGFVLDVTLSLLCLDTPDLAVSCPRVSWTSQSCLSQVEASWENLLTILSSFLLAFSLLYFLLLHLLETFPTLPSSNDLILICLIVIVVSCSNFCASFSESFSALSPLLACLHHTPPGISRKMHMLCHASYWGAWY